MEVRILRGEEILSNKKVATAMAKGSFVDLDPADSTMVVAANGGFLGVLLQDVVADTGQFFKRNTLGIRNTTEVKIGSAVDLQMGIIDMLTNNVVLSPATGGLSATTPPDTELEVYDKQPRILQTGGRKIGRLVRYVPANDAEFGNSEAAYQIAVNKGA